MTIRVRDGVWAYTDGFAVWFWKNRMVDRGWVVTMSGDGSTYNGSGDVMPPLFAEQQYGSGQMDFPTAWYAITNPLGQSFALQHISPGVWTVKYSARAGFTGGNATTLPTATDEITIIDDGGTSHEWLPRGSFRFDVIAGESDEAYGFIFGVLHPSTPLYQAALLMDPLTQTLDYNATPNDNVIIGTQHATDVALAPREDSPMLSSMVMSTTAGFMGGWYRYGDPTQEFVAYPPVLWGGSHGTPGTLVPRAPFTSGNRVPFEILNPANLLFGDYNEEEFLQLKVFDDTVEELEIIYARAGATLTTQVGFKGRSRFFKYAKQQFASEMPRLNKFRSRIQRGALSHLWDGQSRHFT